MKKIVLDNQEIACHAGETVLDALLRHNVAMSYSCKQGACQCCLLRSVDGEVPPEAQKGLKAVQRELNYFLACQCYPQQTMTLAFAQQPTFYITGTVVEKVRLNAEIVQLSIHCAQPLNFRAGQFVNLQRTDGLTRSYSIANSRLQTTILNLHIRRLKSGQFSTWVHERLQVGDTVKVSEPQGVCFYLSEQPAQNLLLIGTGSGLAPLAGILTEALQQGHQGEIHLFHGSQRPEGLYWVDEMHALARRYSQFRYTPCVSQGAAPEGFARGRVHEVALKHLPRLKGWRVYLCGHPEMVKQAKIQVFLAGANSGDIYTDAFYVTPAA